MSEITDLVEIYSPEYHAKAGERGEKQWPAKQDMARSLDKMLRPRSVIDVGCGRGWWLEWWAAHRPDVRVVGHDGCADLIKANEQCDPSVRHLIWSLDLRERGWWKSCGGPWDLVICVEVAEHLDETAADGLIDGLCRLGPTVFFSSARPGQKGRHHVNLRDKDYWVSKFRARGYARREDLRREWIIQLRHKGKRYGHNIRVNAMFFTRQDDE